MPYRPVQQASSLLSYFVHSGIECKDDVFAAHQLQYVDLKPTVAPIAQAPVPLLAPLVPAGPPGNGAIVAIIPEEERPIPVTELIFAPLNKNMNKGFFMPLPDEGHTMLKDEPEILDHLAPSAGDACIPLENSPFDEMFNDFLSDNYCSLSSFLGDDLGNGSPVDSMSPESLLISSPEPRENDSSCEQSSLLTELSLDACDNTRSDNDIDDGNSPFIPTSDELPVLEPAVMWGALPDSVSMARPQPPEPVTVTSSPAPALQRLLTATTTGPPPQDLIPNLYSDQGVIPSRTLSSWDTGCKRVLKQEQEPCAKRIKRSPSPSLQKPTSTQSSSVLMNLLVSGCDVDAGYICMLNQIRSNYQLVRTPHIFQQNINKNAIPIINIMQAVPNKQAMRTNSPINQVIRSSITSLGSPMSPLSLNIGSPNMYSLPSSPAMSPAQRERVMSPYSPKYSLPPSPNSYSSMSPAQRDRVMSPYTPRSMSPVGKYQVYSPGSRMLSPTGLIQGSDPYLTTKMQASPGITLQHNELLLDTNVQLSPGFWPDSEMLQGTSDLLTAFDDVKLV
ncbi:putative hypoxia-inducible factor 1 alpha [Operophtera brumata]|uniref:Putative hypoxia-inducible factor 1 alpha n=1 Tax=Operophtera brumata TaxID=104452 RepID=A0A0L7L2P6_OPEBR|nr:putative hypoxia-inducible factor 1 alpha [Operophtera brumata]